MSTIRHQPMNPVSATVAEFAASGFTPAAGQEVLESDTGIRRLGNGAAAVASLARVSGPLSAGTVSIKGGSGVPTVAGAVGDLYVRSDGADGSWLYRCTVAGGQGVATWVAKL